jgi:uncharacterized protein (TIGR02246 family)
MMLPLEKRGEKQDRPEPTLTLMVPRRKATVPATVLAVMVMLLGGLSLLASTARAQNQRNNRKEPETTGIVSPVPIPDAQAIDLLVSQMLGAWQVGDVEMMHKYYADDVTVVSGAWEPPLFGWDNYVRAYRAQRARTQSGRLDRTNTYTKVFSDTAWVTYQWEFTGQVDGNPASSVGHTTLVLQKRAGTWLIALNHTSVVPTPVQPTPALAVPSPQPGNAAPSHPGA